MNSLLINQLWLGKKHNVNQEIVNTPIQDGGIGLKNLEKCVITAKLMNIHALAFNSLENQFIPTFKKSKAFKNLQKDLQKDGIEILELAAEKITIQYYFQTVDIIKSTTSKELYEFLVKSIITIPCFRNVNRSAMKLNISPNIVHDFLSKLWKNKKLKSFDKNILSHIIAFRLKGVLDVLIEPHQTAHLSNRNIHTSLLKLQTFATELSKREGIVALDFNKAFDKVDRKYMIDMVERLPLDYQTKNIVSKMYENTKAIVNIEGLFSAAFNTESGVRQGCPMSALIFILAIEPLLQRIQRSKLIKSSQINKSIAFADDVSICINLHSIRNLIIILNKFANISGLTVNITKSKVITEGKTYKQERWKFEKVKCAKILGININIKGRMDIETKRDLMNTTRKAAIYMGPAVSLHARAKNIETFILPKLIYILRHNVQAKTLIKK